MLAEVRVHSSGLSFLVDFLQRPQSTLTRRRVLRIHLWSGLILGLYAFVIGVTGSVLVFEAELQGFVYPQFYKVPSSGATLADPLLVLRNVERAYPGYRVSSVNWPTPERNSFVSYPSLEGDTRTEIGRASCRERA